MLQRERRKINKLLSAIVCFLFMFSIVPITALADEVQAITTSAESSVEIKVGQVYSGFKLVDEKPLDDVVIKTFLHEKTGARLTYFENDDENKEFSIGFKTLPEDNTGVNHIIEHSVFGGSEKFPVKDLLSRLPSSLRCLFMNAFTSNDATIYPVASKYDKDFRALMDVYLDMVFNPNLLRDENIFRREGWRYELNSKDDELKINGIVYNEMKGYYSQTEGIFMQHEILKSLFPDTIYKYESGGHPDNIPELSYEQFKETYKKYYTPSNANIVLCGKMDILETLKFINDNHLSKFNKETVDSKIELQKPFDKMAEVETEYSISKNVSTENKSIMLLNYVVDTVKDRESLFALDKLSSILGDTSKSPLAKALKDAGYKGNMESVVIGNFQPVLSIILRDIDKSEKGKYEKIIKDTLAKIVDDGFDKELVNEYFKEPKDDKDDKDIGIYIPWNKYFIVAQQFLKYDLDCAKYVDASDIEENIKNAISKGDKYFEKYIQDKIINNKHCSLIMINPKPGLEEVRGQNLKKKLDEFKASLTPEKLDEIVGKTAEFKKWNDTPLTKEQIATIPTAEKNDDKVEYKKQERKEKNIDGVKVLYYPCKTDDDVYMNVHFNTNNVPQDKLNYLKLYTLLNGATNLHNASKEDFEKLCNDEEINLVAIEMNVPLVSTTGDFIPMIQLNGSFKIDKTSKAISAMKDMMMDIDYGDKKNIEQAINDQISFLDKLTTVNSEAIPRQSILSTFSDVNKHDSIEKTLQYKEFLKNIVENFSEEWPKTVKEIKEVEKKIFNKDNTMVSMTCDAEKVQILEDNCKVFIDALGDKPFVKEKYEFASTEKNMAYINNDKGLSVVKGGNFLKHGGTYNGSTMVTASIINEYLINTVRVKGGAYTVYCLPDLYGNIVMCSLNDPNIKETLDYYDATADYLKNLKMSQEELNKYISVTLNAIDQLMVMIEQPSIMMSQMDNNYLIKMDDNYLQIIRDEIVNTKPEDIRKFGEVLEKVLSENNYSVSGNKEKILENKELFSKVVDLSSSENNNTENLMEELQKKAMRINGTDRYETASNISSQVWQQADTAIICYGENYADALSAISLSKKYDAPILLTKTEKLDDSTKKALENLKVRNAIIIGGEGVVSSEVEKSLTSMGLSTERIFGKDRYETSLKVAEKLGEIHGIVLTTGKDYVSGLSMATYAANHNMAVLLVDNDDMSIEMSEYIKAQKVSEIYYAGNDKTIGKNILSVIPHGKRIFNDNRYSENIEILNNFKDSMNYENVFVVNGEDFADALCAAAVAAKTNAPVVFMNKKVEDSTKEYLKNVLSNTQFLIIIGSEGAVSNETLVEHFK
ncbi:hypothetical protein SAMN02745248_00364 [Hathewaya proteolytica DSM 3090]|uniref:Peptidase M16C associated domain-containing protein n=1 Tax=Hathewaya proteolytica DSM 3090 TaxID=1121331 RepID=A0A1M6K7H4_9CLOT|nr:cell wall-binding repeat-containing protein [Hathewaya proteolytica]SHJ54946.1 hypothetical protein SAMN02745248_00364 [Hathewaya proteolytica DSM 3090]